MFCESGISQNFFDPSCSLTARDLVQRGEKFKIFASRKTREKRTLGGDSNPDLAADFAGIAFGIETAHAYRSRIGQEHG